MDGAPFDLVVTVVDSLGSLTPPPNQQPSGCNGMFGMISSHAGTAATLRFAFGYMLGPTIGGVLAQPSAQYPALFGGVALLELGGLSGQQVAGNADGLGDAMASLLALLQPVGFGTSYLRIEALMKRYPTHGLQISALQLVSNAAIAIAWCGLESVSWAGSGAFELSALYEPSVLGGVLYTGLVSTALTVLDACMCPR